MAYKNSRIGDSGQRRGGYGFGGMMTIEVRTFSLFDILNLLNSKRVSIKYQPGIFKFQNISFYLPVMYFSYSMFVLDTL